MSTITSRDTQTDLIQKALEEFNNWNSSQISQAQEFDKLLDLMNQLQEQTSDLEKKSQDTTSEIAKDKEELAALQEKLNALKEQGASTEEIAEVVKDIQAVISTIISLSQQLSMIKDKLSQSLDALDKIETALATLAEALHKQSDLTSLFDYAHALRERQAKEEEKMESQPTPFRFEYNAQKAINQATVQFNTLSDQIQAILKDISTQQATIDDKEHEATAETHKAVIAGIVAVASCAFVIPSVIATVVGIFSLFKRSAAKEKQKEAEETLAKDKAALQDAYEQLKTSSIAELSQLSNTLEKLLDSISATDGSPNANTMQTAGVALVQALQFLQLFLSKAQEKRSENQQTMSQGAATAYGIASNKINDDYLYLSSNQFYASFIKALMLGAQALLLVGSVAAAVVTGGAGSILIAAVSIISSSIGLYTSVANGKSFDLLEELSDAMAKMVKDKPAWAQALSKILIAATLAAVCILIDRAFGAKVALNAAGASIANASESIAARQAESLVINASVHEAESVAAQNIVGSANGTSASIGKQFGLYFVTSAAVTDSFGASLQAMAEAFVKKEDLDRNTFYQIIHGVIELLQAIAAIVAMHYSFANMGSNSSQLIKQLMDKLGLDLNMSSLMKLSSYAFIAGGGLTAVSTAGNVPFLLGQANALDDIAKEQYVITMLKNDMEQNQKGTSANNKQFSDMIQALMQQTNETARNMVSADLEAARRLAQVAV